MIQVKAQNESKWINDLKMKYSIGYNLKQKQIIMKLIQRKSNENSYRK
jgi:hypothetical protein